MKNKFQTIVNTFLSVSKEKNLDKVLEKIVETAMGLTGADGGSLYIKDDNDKHLEFKIAKTTSLGIQMGGTHSKIDWKPLNIYNTDGSENREMVAVLCMLKDKIINIPNVYEAAEFNFDGTKKFDHKTGYYSKSMLVVPLRDHEDNVIGVLQMINKLQKEKIVSFDYNDEYILLSLGNLAATSLTKDILIYGFQELLESLIKTIGIAIDNKSQYTGGHVRRVAKIAMHIAKEVNASNEGKFRKVLYNELDYKKIKIAGWLHDIGKIVTPNFVMDKSTKLEATHDRIETVRVKFELAKKEQEIAYLKGEITEKTFEEKIKKLQEDLLFIERMNRGGEFLSEEDQMRIKEIGDIRCADRSLLSEDEVENLSIKKGTLNEKERKIIQDHAFIGHEMLERLYFPKKLREIKHIAANHHEKLNGKGYPQGLSAKDLTLEDRIMAVADIFEALTAKDRPYKEPKKYSEVFKILYYMTKEGDLDREVIGLFIKSKAYLHYADAELKTSQMDEIPSEIRDYFLAMEEN